MNGAPIPAVVWDRLTAVLVRWLACALGMLVAAGCVQVALAPIATARENSSETEQLPSSNVSCPTVPVPTAVMLVQAVPASSAVTTRVADFHVDANTYSYVNGNPINMWDPTGHFGIPDWMEDGASYVKHKAVDAYKGGKKKADQVKDYTTKKVHQGVDLAKRSASVVKEGYEDTTEFVSRHKEDIARIAVETAAAVATAAVIVAAVGGTAACAAVTAGLCLVAVGAAAGAVAAGVGYATFEDDKSWGGFGQTVGVGGLFGGATAGLGTAFSSVGRSLASRAPAALQGMGTSLRSALGVGARNVCSFDGDTAVLMADGSKKPIREVDAGDEVIATDPETGEQRAEPVEQVLVHPDTVIDLLIGGEVLTTTEDHPFWSVTDQRFERADELAPAEEVLAADGRVIEVAGLARASARQAMAYNLAVREIHTFHVGSSEVLVHNTCPANLSPAGAGRRGAFGQAKRDAGVPVSATPSRVLPNLDRRGLPQPGRVYEFEVPAPGGGTRTVKIRDDAGGHSYPDDPMQNRGPHFNTEDGGHYDY